MCVADFVLFGGGSPVSPAFQKVMALHQNWFKRLKIFMATFAVMCFEEPGPPVGWCWMSALFHGRPVILSRARLPGLTHHLANHSRHLPDILGHFKLALHGCIMMSLCVQ